MNKRTKDIVGELLKADKTLTISDLASRFKVSERTIRNDLNSINDWLGENGLSLITLGSSGRIQYQPEIEEVQKFVLENDFYSYKLSKEERKMLTAAILLSSSEYTTLAGIADMLFVSRVTVINDLDDVKAYIARENLKVISHSNKGLRVEGAESRKRRMLLLMNRTQQEYGQLDFAGSTLKRLLGIDSEEQVIIQKIINEQEHANQSFLTDDSFLELSLYLGILLKRIRQGEFVEEQKKTGHNPRYPMASGILKYLVQYCQIAVTEAEVLYLSILLTGLRYLKKDDFNSDIIKTQLITRQFIEAVSGSLELDFNNDYVFYENLSNHLQSIFESSDIPFKESAVLKKILEKNRQIESAVEKNKGIIEKYIRRALTGAELTYIAVHICAAIERKKNKEVAFHVIVVCHGGIGTSQLLLERLKKHFNFQIVDVMSAHEVKRIRKDQADMVISTVRLPECELDSVVVTPSLDDADYLRVGHLIDEMRSRKNLPPRTEKTKITARGLLSQIKPVLGQYDIGDREGLWAKIQETVMECFGTEEDKSLFAPMLHHLLSADWIDLDVECKDWREAVKISAEKLLREGYIEERYIGAMIGNIEENGPYVVISPGFALPHDAVDAGTRRVGMNLIRLKEPVMFGDEEAEPVRYVCCLSAVDHDRHLKAFFHLVNLLQNPAFKQMLESSTSAKEVAAGIRKFEYELEG